MLLVFVLWSHLQNQKVKCECKTCRNDRCSHAPSSQHPWFIHPDDSGILNKDGLTAEQEISLSHVAFAPVIVECVKVDNEWDWRCAVKEVLIALRVTSCDMYVCTVLVGVGRLQDEWSLPITECHQ